jgi:hypothetical protein
MRDSTGRQPIAKGAGIKMSQVCCPGLRNAARPKATTKGDIPAMLNGVSELGETLRPGVAALQRTPLA